MQILKYTFIVFEVLLVFNLLIFVHELGHFLAAKWRGLKIDRFAVWFGKPIWKTKIGGVEYALGTIPAGGYVALPQMASMEMIEGKGESGGQPLPPISAMDKIIVAFAGPLFSFLLAVAFAWVVFLIGRPMSGSDNSTVIGWVDPEGPAWNAGLRPGDKILEVDGHKVTQFMPPSQDSVTWRVVTSEGPKIAIKYERDNKELMAYAIPTNRPTKWYERRDLRHILIGPAREALVYDVVTNSPAAVAGLQHGDQILAMNDERIYSFDQVLYAEETMTNGPIEPMTLTVKRGGSEFKRTIIPAKPLRPANHGPLLGIMWDGNQQTSLVHPGPMDQIKESATQIVATLGAIFSRKNDVSVQQLGGAVMIIRLYTNLFDSPHGWRQVLWFSVVLNVNLALLNLLPFPVLDGGHITLALIEVIRRKPVSARLLNYIQTACAVLLIGFMLFIAFFDAGDWIRSAHRDRVEPIVFSPQK